MKKRTTKAASTQVAANNNPHGILTALTARNVEFRTEKIGKYSHTVPDQTRKMSKLAEAAKRGMPLDDVPAGIQPLYLGEEQAAHFRMMDPVEQASFVKQQRRDYWRARAESEKKMRALKLSAEEKRTAQLIEDGVKARLQQMSKDQADPQKPA